MSKPYDRLFKTLAEEDPRGLLHLFGSVPLEVEAQVRAVEREVAAPALEVDHVYHVQTAEEEWLEHYEVQTRYKSDVPERLVWYGVTLALRSRLPVRTTLVLLAERYAPARVRASGQVKTGCLEMISRYRVVKVWKLEAAMVLRLGRPSLLPWVALMRGSPGALRSAAKEIVRLGSRKLAEELVVLGGLRYDKKELAAMLGRLSAMLTEEMLQDSSYYQMILEKGMEKGIEEGSVTEARRVLRLVLSLRFPGLEGAPELDAITERERLEALLAAVVTAADREGAGAVIRGAAISS